MLIPNVRQAFVQTVGNLDEVLSQSQQKHDEVAKAPAVQEALQDLKPKRDPGAKNPANLRYLQPDSIKLRTQLQIFKKEIKTVSVKLDADRTASRLSATVNKVKGNTFVVDPTQDLIQVSAKVAKQIHLVASKEDAPFKMTMADGQELSAQPATILSIEIDHLKVENVPCLILLDDYEGPSILGANFLDRFVSKLDSDTGTLTLTSVDVPLKHDK